MKIVSSIFLFLSINLYASKSSLNFLHGLWEGHATHVMPNGEAISMTSAECVYGKLGGRIGVVEGRHIKEDGLLGFGTYAVLSPIDVEGKYRFSIYLNEGTTREATANIDADKKEWNWSFDVLPKVSGQPIIEIRYTITLANGQWNEIGHSSTDKGLHWKQFFEMKLDRKADTCTGFQ